MQSTPRAPVPLLIVFMDYTRFTAEAQRREEMELAETINESYRRITAGVESSGGTIVKFIGDATLAVYPEPTVDAAVRGLLELKPEMDQFMIDRGWDCRLAIKVHFGRVVAGPFGATGAERFDVIGRAVNVAAKLGLDGVTLTAEAFHRCSPDIQRQFNAQTPTTYVGVNNVRLPNDL